MIRHWTFGQKISAGFTVMVVLTLLIASVSMYSLRTVVKSKDQVIAVNTRLLVDARSLESARDEEAGEVRGFLLTGEEKYLERMRSARGEFSTILERLKRGVYTDEGARLLQAIGQAEAAHQRALEEVIALRRTNAPLEAVARTFDESAESTRKAVKKRVESFVSREAQRLDDAKQKSTQAAARATNLTLAIAATNLLFAVLGAFMLVRSLNRQIGTAVGHVQSSSSELQAAASQQASGAKEQASAVNEITSTINELLVTSRQIAESAQRVAQLAQQTATAAGAGEHTVEQAHESIAAIRDQVDLVVSHMLDLGKKSQQIGAVLDIVSELAEQTNILAINAAIEAAGAGETGKRFAVVAEEIRELADRVAGSTKKIRTLIEEVRSAVNKTVMVTETGSKAVESGSGQFDEVAAAFKQISELVTATTEAAREIELSTKQQTSAVAQVNVAVANVAQTTKETEASSGQTLETVSQLASLSKDLLRLVQPQVAAVRA